MCVCAWVCMRVRACVCLCVHARMCERHRAQVWKTENGKTLLIAFIFSLFTKRKKDSWDQDTHAQKKSWLYSVLINRVNSHWNVQCFVSNWTGSQENKTCLFNRLNNNQCPIHQQFRSTALLHFPPFISFFILDLLFSNPIQTKRKCVQWWEFGTGGSWKFKGLKGNSGGRGRFSREGGVSLGKRENLWMFPF